MDDAVTLLVVGAKKKREYQEETNRPEAERLVRSVGNLPLAIDQAASYIRETGSGLWEVLNVYESDEVSQVSREERETPGSDRQLKKM